MSKALVWLVPIALAMGLVGLIAFFWSSRNGQFEDLDGAAERILIDPDDIPIPEPDEAADLPGQSRSSGGQKASVTIATAREAVGKEGSS